MRTPNIDNIFQKFIGKTWRHDTQYDDIYHIDTQLNAQNNDNKWDIQNSIVLSVNKNHYSECRHTECRYTECRYTECYSAKTAEIDALQW
jgi:hypothetical protein